MSSGKESKTKSTCNVTPGHAAVGKDVSGLTVGFCVGFWKKNEFLARESTINAVDLPLLGYVLVMVPAWGSGRKMSS